MTTPLNFSVWPVQRDCAVLALVASGRSQVIGTSAATGGVRWSMAGVGLAARPWQ